MKSLRRALAPVPDARPPRGLLDTSVVVELEQIEVTSLPVEVAISAITMAELAAGPHASSDAEERAGDKIGFSVPKRLSTPSLSMERLLARTGESMRPSSRKSARPTVLVP